jgi:spore coat protein U-like protein
MRPLKRIEENAGEYFMKRGVLALLAMMIFFGQICSLSAATVSPAPTVAVTGTVQSQCGSAVNGVLSISVDPSSALAQQAFTITTNASIRCTNQKPVQISASSAGSLQTSSNGTLAGTMKNGSNSINYTVIFNNNITGLGFGGANPDVPILVSGFVAQADAQNAVYLPVGQTYTDTVTLTITY